MTRCFSFLRVMSKILGSSTADTQNLMLKEKLFLPPPSPAITDLLLSPIAEPAEDMVGERFSEMRGSMVPETTAVGTTKLL
jgi:hypothetical protein